MVRVKPSEKLFYRKYTHKIIFRQLQGTAADDFLKAIEKIKKWLDKNAYEYKGKNCGVGPGISIVGGRVIFIGDRLGGWSLCFKDLKVLEHIEAKYASIMRELHKVMSEQHAQALTDGLRVRVRSLFFGKYKYLLRFSRFKANQLGIGLGEVVNNSKTNPHSGIITYRTTTYTDGEVQEFFTNRTNDLKIVNDWDVTVYCNDTGVVTMARLKYDEIISELVLARPIEELT